MLPLLLMVVSARALPAIDDSMPAVTSSASIAGSDARQLADAGASPAPPTGLWAAARRFFTFRDHLRVKLKKANATSAMPISYGVSYKSMIRWYCAKPEKKEAKLCLSPQHGGPASAAKAGPALSNSDSKDVYKLYCAEKLHKTTPICAMSALKGFNASYVDPNKAGRALGRSSKKFAKSSKAGAAAAKATAA